MRLNRVTLRRPAYWLALSLALAAVPLLAGCGTASQPETSPADAAVINLPIENRSTTLTREDLRVTQGETVRLTVTADEAGEVHLHGYDLSSEVSPGQPGYLAFEAATAGAFAVNFHVFAPDQAHSGPDPVISDTPISVDVTAEPDARGGVDVQIAVEGFRFAPDLVDQTHTPGAGHAHIYVDGEKLGRVFDTRYRIDTLPPGEREIRVTLNTNDHNDLVFDGKKLEATTTVIVPDAGQGHGAGDTAAGGESNGHSHSHGSQKQSEREVVAEVHLGNLEVYP